MTKLDGDYDVFGDGSVTILATPGHTPSHQSLLVKLPKTGALVLSGDVVHFRADWLNRRAPLINFDKEKTAASLRRVADVLVKEKAQRMAQMARQEGRQVRIARAAAAVLGQAHARLSDRRAPITCATMMRNLSSR